MEIQLPYPPSINSYWRSVARRAILSRRVGNYWEAVVAAVVDQLGFSDAVLLDGPVAVALSIVPSDRKRRDLDNLLKAVINPVVHSHLIRATRTSATSIMSWTEPVAGGSVRLTVTPIYLTKELVPPRRWGWRRPPGPF